MDPRDMPDLFGHYRPSTGITINVNLDPLDPDDDVLITAYVHFKRPHPLVVQSERLHRDALPALDGIVGDVVRCWRRGEPHRSVLVLAASAARARQEYSLP